MVSFFLYLSVIITADGVVKTHTEVVEQCPTTEQVMQWHQSMIASGEIVDWRAKCTPHTFDIPMPEKGINT